MALEFLPLARTAFRKLHDELGLRVKESHA